MQGQGPQPLSNIRIPGTDGVRPTIHTRQDRQGMWRKMTPPLRSRKQERGAREQRRRGTPPCTTKYMATRKEAYEPGCCGGRRAKRSLPVPPPKTNPNQPRPTSGLPPPECGTWRCYDAPPKEGDPSHYTLAPTKDAP